jgi:hypothetical protein
MTPFMFTTGYDRILIPDEFRDVPRIYKPYDLTEILDRLIALVRQA